MPGIGWLAVAGDGRAARRVIAEKRGGGAWMTLPCNGFESDWPGRPRSDRADERQRHYQAAEASSLLVIRSPGTGKASVLGRGLRR